MIHREIIIRVFKAVDDLESCQKFVEGHMKVLKIFGITMITSANIEWFVDPNTYVILVESKDRTKVLGGARIQIAGGKKPLPIETAVADMDPSIHEMVKTHAEKGTGELCGLWNSREVAGLGVGSIFLTRVGVAISTFFQLHSLFALCAPITVDIGRKAGFVIETSLGINGTFYYPKEDLLATAVVLRNTTTLESAEEFEKERIFDLRKNPLQTTREKGPRGEVDIEYNLIIK
ncbi:MAG: hypothetical protein K2X86_01175 [Cytophagaceae bacterium]|nr:hypothetical protein [Cytophagaceae bacterium]